MGVTHHGLLTTMTNDIVVCHLVAMLPSVTWHLDPVSEKWMGEASCLTSARRRLCLFVGAGCHRVIHIHLWAFFVIWALFVIWGCH